MKMNRWAIGLVGAMLLAGGGLVYYQGGRDGAPGGLPEQVLDRMEFPKGTDDMVGDSQGRMCHELRLRNSAGEHVIGREEVIPDADFRMMNGAQKRAAIIGSAKRIAGRAGIVACTHDPALPFPGLASDATAQPHCLDCNGGCGGVSCPAHVTPFGYCQMQGPDCIIGIICCSGSCNCW